MFILNLLLILCMRMWFYPPWKFHVMNGISMMFSFLPSWQVNGQQAPRKKKKKPVRKKLDLKGHIQCFECFRDYSVQQPFYGYDLCYNPNLEPQRSLDEYLVTCPKGSTVCQVDIHRLNGIFIALERKCAPLCHCICKNSGFGLEREICSECQKPVDYQTFDNETLPDFTCTL